MGQWAAIALLAVLTVLAVVVTLVVLLFTHTQIVLLPSNVGAGCQGGVQPYLPTFPNPHYYTKFCTTHQGLQVN